MNAETAKPRIRDIIRQPRMVAILLLGAVSGLPNQLSESVIQAWFKDMGFTNTQIGLMLYVATPYLLKPLWAPFFDRFTLPWLGRRRGWLLLFQLLMILPVAALGFMGSQTPLTVIAAVLLVIVFLSASQDVVINAYTTDVARPHERGMASAAANVGYRATSWGLAALALVVAQYGGWRAAFFMFAIAVALFTAATFRAPEPDDARGARLPTFAESVIVPLRELLGSPGVIALMVLILFYKIGDAFALRLFTPFLMDVGFPKDEVGILSKFMLAGGAVVGGIIGGVWMLRIGLARAMVVFSLIQAFSNLGYLWLNAAGKNYAVMFTAVGFDAFASGMGNIASVALIMGICDKRYTAFQYSLLASIALIPRYTLSYPAGVIADIGWNHYYWTSFALAIPGIVLAWVWRRRVSAVEDSQSGVASAGSSRA